MKHLYKVIIAISLFASLAGCMTTPVTIAPEKDFTHLFPPLKKDLARIFFYRPQILSGSLITPPVNVNGVYVGNSLPGEYFYIDIYKGNYRIEISEGKILELKLAAGEERFIKMDLGGTGIFYDIIPKLANPEVARHQIIQMYEMKERMKGN